MINKLIVYVFWVLIVILGLNLFKDIGRAKSIRGQIASEQAKLSKIEADNAKLESELAAAKSSDFIEKEVRDKLGLSRQNEAVVVLPDTETLRKLAPQITTTPEVLPPPTWKKWMKLFLP